MTPPLDLTGQRYGRLRVKSRVGVRNQKSYFLCACDCGREVELSGNALRTGNTRSCGCLRADILREPRVAHVEQTCPICDKVFNLTENRAEGRTDHCCSRECAAAGVREKGVLAGENNAAWRGGRRMHPSGYSLVRHNGKYVLEHRLVMERHLGRELSEDEHVHHKNEDKTDNRIENLQLTTASDHRHLHPMKTWGKRGRLACVECGTTEQRHVTRGLCTRCYDRERYRLKGRRDKR